MGKNLPGWYFISYLVFICLLFHFQDLGDPRLTSTTTLTLNVEDADDQNPKFSHEEYTLFIMEEVWRLLNKLGYAIPYTQIV